MRSLSTCVGCLVVLLNTLAVTAADVGLPAEFVNDCELYLGDWSTEAEIGGKVYRGEWFVKWSPDKTCLVTHWSADSPNGLGKGTRVHGWDSVTKKVLVVDFGTGGSSSIERYTLTSGKISEGEMSGVDAEGKQFQATARTEWKKPDFFTWTVTRDGQAREHRFQRTSK